MGTRRNFNNEKQTEEGTPNELNRFIKQDETGASIKDIKLNDSVYQQGFIKIKKLLEQEPNKIRELYLEDE